MTTTHTMAVSASWYVVNEGENAWGIGYRPKEDRKLIVQKAVKDYIDTMKTLPKKYKNSMGFPDLPGFPGSKRLCDECNENPYDKIEIGVTEHYFCNDCHIKWKAHLPEELFEI